MVACVPCDFPYAFFFRVKDNEAIFLVAGSDVCGAFDKFTDVDFCIETKRIPVLEDTNCMRGRGGIRFAEDADLLSEHRDSNHPFILVHFESNSESVGFRTDDCKDNKLFEYYNKLLIIMKIYYYTINNTDTAYVFMELNQSQLCIVCCNAAPRSIR